MHTLGWIGLGHMGAPMATNLRAAEHRVNVYNRSADKTAPLVQIGAVAMASPKAVAEASDIIFTMLTNAEAVQAVLSGEDGILAGITPGKIVVDMSTVSPEDSKSFAKQVEAKGGTFLDAPVSGSVGAAKAKQLVILAGGTESTLDTCRPYLADIGKDAIHFGENGAGSAAKLSINLLLGVMGQGFAEAILFAEKLGLDKETLLHTFSQSAFNNPFFQMKKEMFLTETFPSAFMTALMSKDLGLIKGEVNRMKGVFPLAVAADATYRSAKENGKGAMDMAAIYLELKEQNR